MQTLTELENSVVRLSTDDYTKFRDWFLQYESEQWDIKIEKDVADNKLEALAKAAIYDFKDGKYSAL